MSKTVKILLSTFDVFNEQEYIEIQKYEDKIVITTNSREISDQLISDKNVTNITDNDEEFHSQTMID